MKLMVRDGASSFSIDAEEGQSVLSALQHAGITVDAPCGGAGKCGKCRMLVHDETGLSYRLTCEVPVSEGMEVTVPGRRAMVVSEGGRAMSWPVDANAHGFGLAIDVGTTTVVSRLYNLESGEAVCSVGRPNPQIAFGADVITRISACAEGSLSKMESLLGEELVSMACALVEDAGITLADITRVVLAANTVMEHIAAGIDPQPIGVAPFVPPTLFGEEVDMPAFKEAGICDGKVLYASCIAGYVGGDITCGLLAQSVRHSDDLVLLLDLGTNGEMALGDKTNIVTCATAAGPVFEGANIKYGMPAYTGAISKVSYDGTDLSLSVIGDVDPVGICGTGLIDTMALMLKYGLVDETGRIVDDDEIDHEVSQGMERWLVEEDGNWAFRLSSNVVVTQADIRALQLAKAAVCAGIRTLLGVRGTDTAHIGKLMVAGGFGEFLNLEHAAIIGLFPAELVDRARSVGNTSIEGAGAACVSADAREQMALLAQECDYVELSTNRDFDEFYLDELEFDV